VDDSRYARLWLDARISCRASSPRRLLAALCAKGINRDDAQAALTAALDADAEYLLLSRYAEKLLRSRRPPAETKAFKYTLKSEGFSSAAIQRLLDDEAIPN
jgi:SOS response regulatory protein OraA/RecX